MMNADAARALAEQIKGTHPKQAAAIKSALDLAGGAETVPLVVGVGTTTNIQGESVISSVRVRFNGAV